MSAAPASASELISPAMRKVIGALMQKMEKNLKDHYSAELSSLRSEVNVLKVKVSELERQLKRSPSPGLPTAAVMKSSKPVLRDASASERIGIVERRKLLSKQKSTATTIGKHEHERFRRKRAGHSPKPKGSPSHSAKAMKTATSKKPLRKVHKKTKSKSKALDTKKKKKLSTTTTPDDLRKSPQLATSSTSAASSMSAESEMSASEKATRAAVRAAISGFSLDVGKKHIKVSSAPGIAGAKALSPALSPTAADTTMLLLSTDLTAKDDASEMDSSLRKGRRKSPRTGLRSPKKKTRSKSPGFRKTGAGSRSYKAKGHYTQASFAAIDEIFIGNRYALIDGRWGICKYYDPRADVLGIELEMGIGEETAEYKGKERWKLDSGKKACFVARKKLESDCGPGEEM